MAASPGKGCEDYTPEAPEKTTPFLPTPPRSANSFSDYVLGDFEARWGWENDILGTGYNPAKDEHEFRKRLAKANIVGLNGLLRWTRERYPDFYYKTHVWNGGGTGKKLFQRVWADYLLWAGR